MNYRNKFAGVVGPGPYRHGLFYTFPGGLRFGLSEGGSALDRVLMALHKASAICSDVFAQQETIHVHLQKYCAGSRFRLRHTLRELGLSGLSIPRRREIWIEPGSVEEQDDGQDEGSWVNVAFEVPKSKLQNLLWCAFTNDLTPLRPNPHCRVYLVDPEQSLIVHPYDDRGVDIVGRTRAPLQALYNTHKEWLLDYDLDAINQTFAGR